MQKKSRTQLALEQFEQEQKSNSLLEVIDKPRKPKVVPTTRLVPTKINPAKNEAGTVRLINELQDKHFLVLFHILGKKVFWCEGHHMYLTKKDCPIRTYIGPLTKPIKTGEEYMYITRNIQSIPPKYYA